MISPFSSLNMSRSILKGIAFDLDDTLYLERDYVMSGFRAVAARIEEDFGIPSRKVLQELWRLFQRGVRGNTFDLWLSTQHELAHKVSAHELVGLYRSHKPEIELMPGTPGLLGYLRQRGMPLALISDGFLKSQQRKAKVLELEKWIEIMIYTDAWGKPFWKPHARAFEEIMRLWSSGPERLVYVADNPEKDFVTPRRLGWKTVRLRLPAQLRYRNDPFSVEYAAEVEVGSVEHLKGVLEEWL